MQTYDKQPAVAMLLAIIPGVGHLYWGQYIKTLLYGGAALTPPALFAAVTLFEGRIITELFFLALLGIIVVWCVNMADMALTLSRRSAAAPGAPSNADTAQRDRALATALSLIPGAGHAFAGAPRRGQLYFAGALAALAAPLAAAMAFDEPALLLLWLAVPALMLAAADDAAEALRRKELFGELAADEAAAEPWFAPAANGGRPAVALLLSVVPGAGHVYLGDTGKGLRLLCAALLLLYAKMELHLSIAAFAFPALWAFALADLRQRVFGSMPREAEGDVLQLTPASKRWAGAALVAIGLYMAFDRIALEALGARCRNSHGTMKFASGRRPRSHRSRCWRQA